MSASDSSSAPDPVGDAAKLPAAGAPMARIEGRHIEFHIRADLMNSVPHPFPAAGALPEWLKTMPMESTQPGFSTMKRCPPFLDAMTCGYIIPVPTDITLNVRSHGIEIEVVGFGNPMVMTHESHQWPGAPFPPQPVLKFINPWIVKTPPGYSTLFVAPLNRFGIPVFPLAGVVDTDVLYQEIHFPTLCLIPMNQSAVIPRGTPLIQAIPFPRETWSSSTHTRDEPAFKKWRDSAEGRTHSYKEDLWKKKTFT